MIYRLLTIFKRTVFGFFRILWCILRCGRRKKAQVDDSQPTDIVIGDAINTNFSQTTGLKNGYEVTSPAYYDHPQEPRHPFQSQVMASVAGQHTELNRTEDIQMQSWDQWDYEETSATQKNEMQSHQKDNEQKAPESPQDGEVDFFADMEPSVKVKKIYIKKKQKDNERHKNRFALDQNRDFRTSQEDFDADWHDDDAGEGWAEEDFDIGEIDTAKVAKEARQLRKQERMQRTEEQRRQKLAKKPHHKDHRLGMKVS